MSTLWFLFSITIKNLLKGDWAEAEDAWNWTCFHFWYLIRGKARKIK